MSQPVVYYSKTGPLTTIDHLDICVMGPDEIRRLSVVEVTEASISEKNLMPKNGSVSDHRMGVVDRCLSCGTCGNKVAECNGHIGHIELAYPVYLQGFIEEVLKILRSVCYWCSRLKIHASELAKCSETGKQRFATVSTLAKKKKSCPHCDSAQPQYLRKKHPLVIDADWKEVEFDSAVRREMTDQPFTPLDALEILMTVPYEDYILLGFDPYRSHPSNTVMRVMVVPPPIIRPSIRESRGSRTRGQDDLTHKLRDIVVANNALREYRKQRGWKTCADCDRRDEEFRDLLNKLQSDTATYHNNEIRGHKQTLQRSGAPQKSIHSRLKGKTGRVRGDLNGKRVNFCGRSVITPDSRIDVHEVGVPECIARVLTYPERVNCYNYQELTERVRNGPNSLFGAKNVITSDNETIPLNGNDEGIELQNGWIVERHMKNGDYVLFNRQPSLHKQSMMGHRARIMPGKTFRLPPCTTGAYNADFDGDEMNLHLPQNQGTRAETALIMNVPNQIVSPQSNKPVLAIIQDVRLGAFFFTRRNILLDRVQVMDLLMHVKYGLHFDGADRSLLPPPSVIRVQDGRIRCYWTGKQLISLLLPRRTQVCKRVRDFEETDFTQQYGHEFDWDERYVLIRDGELLCGALCKQTIGGSAGDINHVLYKDVSPDSACHFMSDLQRIINQWLMTRGFSVGIEDCMGTPGIKKRVDVLVQRSEEAIYHTLSFAHGLCGPPAKKQRGCLSNEKDLEGYAKDVTNRVLDQVGRVIKEEFTVDNNAIQAMVTVPSKGTPLNPPQMMGIVGQQSNEGRRIHSETETRTLPCYPHAEVVPRLESNGFVKHSFSEGLAPPEFFFHTMGGREGIVDTGVKTCETGYIQRKLTKALESNHVSQNGIVKNASLKVIEYAYGNDNCDGTYVERVDCPCVLWSNERVRQYLEWEGSTPSLLVEEYADLVRFRDDVRRSKMCVISPKVDGSLMVTVVVTRLILDHRPREKAPLADAALVRELFVQMLAQLERYTYIGRQKIHGMAMLKLHLQFECCTRVLLQRFRYTETATRTLFAEIAHKYATNMVCPGEMVGAVAAQSLGEPSTQMTLNTFHFAGIGKKNVTLGVPRLKELTDATKKMKKPSATVYLKPPFCSSEQGALRAQKLIECVTLARVTVHSPTLVLDKDIPAADWPLPQDDETWLVQVDRILDGRHTTARLSRYSLRFVLNKNLLLDKGLTPLDVGRRVEQYLDSQCLVTVSEFNMERWVMRVRLVVVDAVSDPLSEKALLTKVKSTLLKEVVIAGIKGIQKAFPVRMQYSHFDDETGEHSVRETWILETEGSALAKILCEPYVDPCKTYSNDIHEVEAVLGIEAAAIILYHELKSVISFDGTYVNDRHFMNTINTMTCHGYLMAMSRHGINRIDSGFLARSSFEETLEVLYSAALVGETTSVRGVTESVMLGQFAPIGTGFGAVCMDKIIRDEQVVPVRTSLTSTGSRKRKARWTDGLELFTEDNEFEVSTPLYEPLPAADSYHPSSPSREPLQQYAPLSPTEPNYDAVFDQCAPVSRTAGSLSTMEVDEYYPQYVARCP